MPTPVQVTCARIRNGRIERLGGMFNGSPWSMAARRIIVEIEKPANKRVWAFEASAHGVTAPVVLVVQGWQKSLEAEGVDLFRLPACPPEQLDDT